MAFRDYSLTPASNTVLSDGTYIGPNMLRNKVRPAFQQIAADGKELSDSFDTAVEAIAGSNVSDVTLRIDMASNTGFTLIKHKRPESGTFARTAAQLLAVNALDSDGVSVMHWIDPAYDDALIAGTNTDPLHTQIQAFFNAFTTKRAKLTFPPLDFKTTHYLQVLGDDILLDLGGSRISGDFTAAQDYFNPASFTGSAPVLAIGGARSELIGGDLRETSSGNVSWRLEVSGHDCAVRGTRMDKLVSPGGSNYQFYMRDCDRCLVDGIRTTGADGIYLDASECLIVHCTFQGEDVGGDDGIAIKSTSGFRDNNIIANNTFRRLSAGCSIGSEVGYPGANDPTRTRGVRGTRFVNNALYECSMLAYLKPGGVEADYRDGLVDDTLISGNTLRDSLGIKLVRGIVMTPGRGALIRNTHGRDNKIIGRCVDVGGRKTVGLDIFLLDLRSATPASTAPSVDRVDIGVSFFDPYDGVAAGGAAPGAPADGVVAIDHETAGFGSATNINIRADLNGSRFMGIYVGAGFDNEVHIERAHLKNVNSDLSASNGGIRTASKITVGEDMVIETLGGLPYVRDAGGGVRCSALDEQTYLFALVAAGNNDTQYPWRANRRCQLLDVALNVTNDPAPSDTNYTRLAFRNPAPSGSGNEFHLATTQATGGGAGDARVNPAPGVWTSLFDRATSAGSAQSLFAEGGALYLDKQDTGAGAALVNARLSVSAAPY